MTATTNTASAEKMTGEQVYTQSCMVFHGDDGKTLLVSSKKGDKVVTVHSETGNKRELDLSPASYHLNTINGTGKVYVSSRKKPAIWVIDQNDLKVVGSINLPAGEAHQMVIAE